MSERRARMLRKQHAKHMAPTRGEVLQAKAVGAAAAAALAVTLAPGLAQAEPVDAATTDVAGEVVSAQALEVAEAEPQDVEDAAPEVAAPLDGTDASGTNEVEAEEPAEGEADETAVEQVVEPVVMADSLGVRRLAAANGAAAANEGADEVENVESGEEQTVVAKIGETEYASLQEAVKAANESVSEETTTITLLSDVTYTNEKLTIAGGKSVEIDGGSHSVTITYKDAEKNSGGGLIGLGGGSSLTLKDVTLYIWDNLNGYNGTIAMNGNTTLTLDNTKMTLDGTYIAGSKAHGIYFWDDNGKACTLNLINSSDLTIQNYRHDDPSLPSAHGDGIEWDGNEKDQINILSGSTYTSKNNGQGITGTIQVTVDNGHLNVFDSSKSGSNGAYYFVRNGSTVDYEGNAFWGLSANELHVTGGSTVTAKNNGYSGIWTRLLEVDGSSAVTVQNNGGKDGYPGIRLIGKKDSDGNLLQSTVAKGATLVVTGNYGAGLQLYQGIANLDLQSGIITNNGSGFTGSDVTLYEGTFTTSTGSGKGSDLGGGIRNNGVLVIGSDVEVYNNTAEKQGDDIYNYDGATITFEAVGSGWYLDGGAKHDELVDCTDLIDGWYDDSVSETNDDGVTTGGRWNAHPADGDIHIVLVSADTYEGVLAIKAAHGIDKLTYYGNGGSIAPEDEGSDSITQYVYDNLPSSSTQTVDENAFEYGDATFIGWNTKADGTGDSYSASGTYMLTDKDDELYAQWRDTLSYDANGGSGTMDDAAKDGLASALDEDGSWGGVTISENGFTAPDGYEFAGWNTKADGSGTAYVAGGDYGLTPDADVLYAQWKKIPEPVTPDEPVVPDEPATPEQPEQAKTTTTTVVTTPRHAAANAAPAEVPQTGDATNGIFAGILAALGLGSVAAAHGARTPKHLREDERR